MTLSLLFLIVIGVIAVLTFILPAMFIKPETLNSTRKVSYGISGLFILHWLLYITGVYALLPLTITNALFMPFSLGLCAIGVFAVIYEFKNNKRFAISMTGLTTISLLFSFFIYGITRM